jgi:glycine cleavage system transcriptional repressor
VTTCQTEQNDPVKFAGWMPYQVEVNGADHEGIIHTITQILAQHNINIETMDTGMVQAPVSGTPLFTMNATVLVPPEISYQLLQEHMQNASDEQNVDIDVSPYKG